MKSKKCPMCLLIYDMKPKQRLCKSCQEAADVARVERRRTAGVTVVEFGPHDRLTVEEVMALTHRESVEYSDVMIIAYHKEKGYLIVRSSNMSDAEANYMIDKAKRHALNQDED